MTPTLSVVIPTYNDLDVLPRAITSVLSQLDERTELVVVDDGSTDGTRDYLATIGHDRLRVVVGDHAGVGAARDTGLRAATGRYVTWLDSDDEALGHWLDEVLRACADDPALVTWGELTVPRNAPVRATMPGALGGPFGAVVGRFVGGTYAVRRDLALAAGGFDRALRHSENTDLVLRVLDAAGPHAPVVVVHHPLVRRNDHPNRDYDRAKLDAATRLLEVHRTRFARAPRSRADYLAVAGVSAARLGERAQARRYFLQAARAWPWDGRHLARAATASVAPLALRAWPRSTQGGDAT